MTSSPDSSSQPTVPTEGPVAGHSSLRISRCESHQGQGQGSAYRTGCPWGVLSPHLPAWLALLGWLKTPTSRKVSACIPDLWPTGHHSRLAPSFLLFLCLLSLSPDPS